MQLPPESRFQLCKTKSGSWQLLRAGEEWMTYLGYDPDACRLVSVAFSSGLEKRRADGKIPSLRRLESMARLRHPTIGTVMEFGETSFGNSYVVFEFVEGEPLLEYLKRNPDLPDKLVAYILLDLVDALGSLSGYPRFFSCVEPNDFLVTLDRGIYPGLRLGRFGLSREDRPVSDFQLARRWTQNVAGIQLAVKEGLDPGQNPDSVPRHPAYAEFEDSLSHKSGVDVVLHLARLRDVIREVSGLQAESGVQAQTTDRKLRHIRQVARGPLQEILFESGDLEDMLREKYETGSNDVRYAVSPFVIPTVKRSTETGQEESARIYLLPPERLFEESLIDPLNQKMFDSYLKSHPNGVRIRSLFCEEDFTLLVADYFEGLPLPVIQARRKRFSSADAMAFVRQLDRVLSQFDSSGLSVGNLTPWQIEVYFESATSEEIPDLIEHETVSGWPSWGLKLRVETPAEVFVEPVQSAWSHLRDRFCGKTFPAILSWLLDGDRFEWALRYGNTETEPLSWNPLLDHCYRNAAASFDDTNAVHRKQLIDYVTAVLDRKIDSDGKSGDGKTIAIEFFQEFSLPPARSARKLGSGFSRESGTVR